jgi:hypothetical protein
MTAGPIFVSAVAADVAQPRSKVVRDRGQG